MTELKDNAEEKLWNLQVHYKKKEKEWEWKESNWKLDVDNKNKTGVDRDQDEKEEKEMDLSTEEQIVESDCALPCDDDKKINNDHILGKQKLDEESKAFELDIRISDDDKPCEDEWSDVD